MSGEPNKMDAMAPQPAVQYFQQPAQHPEPQVQVAYCGYEPVQQQTAVVVGSGEVTMSPSNGCVICLSVFACLCCSEVLGVMALALALVARVFHPDPANAAKAVTLNRYAFRFAIAAIVVGCVVLGILAFYYSQIILMMSNFQGASHNQQKSSSSDYPTVHRRLNSRND